MKTPVDLIYDFFTLLNVQEVLSNISGGVYPNSRPIDSRMEDVVINSLPITGSQLQVNITNVNIHVPNLKISIGGKQDNTQPNLKRLKEISAVVEPIIVDAMINGTVTEIEQAILIEEKELNEHFLNYRVKTHTVNL